MEPKKPPDWVAWYVLILLVLSSFSPDRCLPNRKVVVHIIHVNHVHNAHNDKKGEKWGQGLSSNFVIVTIINNNH